MTSTLKAVTAALAASVLLFAALPAAAVNVQAAADRMLVNDSAEEIEPALISQARFGVDYVVSVYMKFNPNIRGAASTLQFAAYTSNNLSTYGALPTSTALSYYNRFFDPVLVQAENTTNARIYLVAAALRDDAVNGTDDSALVVWSSDNGGWYWTSPYIIESETTSQFVLDKPHATVGPDGRLHVAYNNATTTGSGANLMYRNGTYTPSTGAWSWTTAHFVLGTNRTFANAPQVMVDSNEDVYILYTDDQPRRMPMVRDLGGSGNGLTFTQMATVPNLAQFYGFFNPGGSGLLSEWITLRTRPAPDNRPVNVRAVTIPVARLDRANRRISVAWHESDGAGHSQIKFGSYKTTAATPAWTTPFVIAASGGHDINVGMAMDNSGNYLVTYYSFPGNGGSYYSQVATTVTFSGDTPQHTSGNNTMLTSVLSELTDYAVTATTPNGPLTQHHLGEYHDVSFSNGTFKHVGIVISYGAGNPWVMTATH
jgi:hypothetical protein